MPYGPMCVSRWIQDQFFASEDYPEAMTRPTTVGAEPSRVRDVSRMLEPSRASERFRATRYPEGEVSGLPMVINTAAEAQWRAVDFDRTRLRDLFGDYFCRAGGKGNPIGQRKDCADHARDFSVRRFGITRGEPGRPPAAELERLKRRRGFGLRRDAADFRRNAASRSEARRRPGGGWFRPL